MSRFCLVVLQPPLVAQDLAQTVEELTGCTPLLAASMDDAGERLSGLEPGALSCAFVQTDAAGLRASALIAQLRRLGGQPVLLGHAAEMEAARGEGQADWPVLTQPFGAAQVAEVLERLPPRLATSG